MRLARAHPPHRACLMVLGAALAMLSAPAPAQQAPDPPPDHVQDMLDNEKAMFAPKVHDPACVADEPHDDFQTTQPIIVCSHRNARENQRVPSESESHPLTGEGVNDGRLHAPDVDGTPPCLATCVTGHFGHVPPPVYYLDTTKLPDPPEGSPAWRIAHGLSPEP